MESARSLNDMLNLRTFIEFIIDQIRTYGSSDLQPRTMVGVLTLLIEGSFQVSEKQKPLITDLQKVLAGSLPYTSSNVSKLADKISTGEMDGDLLKNLEKLVSFLESTSGTELFYSKLCNRISIRFFNEEEMTHLRQLSSQGDHARFLLELVKHGFRTMYNLPSAFAERLYEEALTYDYDVPLRFALMREAADCGNKNAALEYGNYLAKTGPGVPGDRGKYKEAFRYFMTAVPLSPALWSLAYMIERRWIGPEQVRDLRASLRLGEKPSGAESSLADEELDGLSYLGDDPVFGEDLLCAYRIYYVLAERKFFKAYNSLAKLLSEKRIGFSGPDGIAKAERLREKYSRIAIGGCNITAISNEGRRLFDEIREEGVYAPSSDRERTLRELLEVASGAELMHARFYLAEYYRYGASSGDQTIRTDQLREAYNRAAALDTNGGGMHGKLYRRLGDFADNLDQRIDLYEKALSKGDNDAAYYLAQCCFEKGGQSNTMKAYRILDQKMQFMSLEALKKSKALLSLVQSQQ